MKQLLVTGPRQASLCDVPCPACGVEEVLVEAQLTAISTGTELRVFRAIAVDDEGRFLHEAVPFQLPAANGYSMVGTVRETGTAVLGLRPGMRVFATAAHAAWAAVSPDALHPLPEAIAVENAVWLNVLEVAHRALRQANPDPGADVAIIGQGVVGLGMLAWSVACGFRTVVVERHAERRAIAREMGADMVLSPDDHDCVAQTIAFASGVGADVVFEAGSSWEAIRVALQVARSDGTIVVMSRHTQRPEFNPVGHPFLGKRLKVVTKVTTRAQMARQDGSLRRLIRAVGETSGSSAEVPLFPHQLCQATSRAPYYGQPAPSLKACLAVRPAGQRRVAAVPLSLPA